MAGWHSEILGKRSRRQVSSVFDLLVSNQTSDYLCIVTQFGAGGRYVSKILRIGHEFPSQPNAY